MEDQVYNIKSNTSFPIATLPPLSTRLGSESRLYNLAGGRVRGASHSVTMWLRVISLSERHPLNAIVSSNSSLSICSTFLTPASPSAANEKTTGRPI